MATNMNGMNPENTQDFFVYRKLKAQDVAQLGDVL